MTDSKTKFVFITGGGVSSLGKGLASAALGSLLIRRGYSVRCRKFDPYLNVDPGTMSPDEHGECYVTDDGAETDLDLGHYERFTGVVARKSDSVSQGMVYRDILEAERRGDFLGRTVQVFPHIIDRIMQCFERKATDANGDPLDYVLCEIGGAVGDIESAPFVEAVRQFIQKQLEKRGDSNGTCLMHLAYMPYIAGADELKTKPVQHAVKDLQGMGLKPDVLVVRSDRPMPVEHKAKIAMFTGIKRDRIISATDAETLDAVPELYRSHGLDVAVLAATGVREVPVIKPSSVPVIKNTDAKPVKIALVGKYAVRDAYMSVYEAVRHAGLALDRDIRAEFVNAEELADSNNIDNIDDVKAVAAKLKDYSGVIVPGGFGTRAAVGKMAAIRYARESRMPYLGICYGMQLAVIEFCRNELGWYGAVSTEFEGLVELDEPAKPVVALMEEFDRKAQGRKGGTMRLGSEPVEVLPGTVLSGIYGPGSVAVGGCRERHRHRYDVDPHYVPDFEARGLKVSAWSVIKNSEDSNDGNDNNESETAVPEAVELASDRHPFFVGVQYHPEFKSRPDSPHPLFRGLAEAAIANKGFRASILRWKNSKKWP